jgi:hypothetical protein
MTDVALFLTLPRHAAGAQAAPDALFAGATSGKRACALKASYMEDSGTSSESESWLTLANLDDW